MSKINKITIIFIIFVLCIIKFNYAKAAEGDNSKTIEDGIYQISSALNSKYVVDIDQASSDNCANVHLFENVNEKQQKFKVKYLGNGYYTIAALHSNKVLDVANGGKTSGTNVWQFEDNGTDAQQWIIKEAEDGYYYIISKWNGLYLDVNNADAKNGTNIQVYTGNNSNAQKFKFEKVESTDNPSNSNDTPVIGTKTIEDGTYQISTALNSKYVVDIDQASSSDCANLHLFENVNEKQQKFNVKYLGDGYYTIAALHSNKVLDVANGGKIAGTNVWQYGANGTDAQKWIIKETGDGYYYIISKWNGLYLDVNNADAKNGTNIQVYTGNDSNAQKFKFEKVESTDNPSNSNDTPVIGAKTIKDGIYQIKTVLNTKYVVDIDQASSSDCANVHLFENVNEKQQKFKVKYLGDGYYTIAALHSNKMLDIENAGKTAGTNVWQYGDNGSDAQKWIIKETEDGYYYIISKCNGLYLDVNNAEAKNGTNIQVYTGNGSNAQKFIFESIQNEIKIDETKYPGYKEKIEALMEAHPTWNFEILYTGLTFDEVIKGETAVHSRNLVEPSHSGEWICSVCGTKSYDSGWYCASEKAVAYYMDPRNFLDEVNVFQFQDVNEYLYGVCTMEGIQNQVNGTYLQNYSNDIDTACRNQNVNPYYIISRLIQEQGRNGTQIGRGMDGGDGKTYYNPFNIGASGNGWNEIYANALARAKKEGWDTMEKAIEGGITFCKANWLDNYQNTLYQNKFDIDTRNGTALYVHQYMQNLMGAYSEARLLQGMYANTNKTEECFTFIIPIYEKMEATYPLPIESSESYPMDVETTGTKINLREGASTDSNILKVIEDKGTKLLSIERGINSNWQKVILTDGTIGYVSGTYLKQIEDQVTCNQAAKVKTNDGDGCNVRVGPSTRLQKLTYLQEGEQVTIIDKGRYNNIDGFDWYRIKLSDGRQAFIPNRYLQEI